MSKVYNLPNFFIVGAAKAGTSSLWQYLKGHPEIYMPDHKKEPRYFSHQGVLFEDYIRMFKAASNDHKRIGEASTTYLTCPDCANLISDFGKKYNLNVKILIFLRNPANRAYSLYNWMVQDGYEYTSSFENALAKEKQRIKNQHPFWDPEYYYNYQYFTSGLYFEQVKRYLEKFGKENVHVEIFEEFIQDIPSSLQKIFAFLNVDTNVEIYHEQIYNPSVQVRAPWLQFILRKITTYLVRSRLLLYSNKKQRDQLMRLGMTKKKTKKLDSELRLKLIDQYRPSIHKLEDLLERDLKIWYH